MVFTSEAQYLFILFIVKVINSPIVNLVSN